MAWLRSVVNALMACVSLGARKCGRSDGRNGKEGSCITDYGNMTETRLLVLTEDLLQGGAVQGAARRGGFANVGGFAMEQLIVPPDGRDLHRSTR